MATLYSISGLVSDFENYFNRRTLSLMHRAKPIMNPVQRKIFDVNCECADHVRLTQKIQQSLTTCRMLGIVALGGSFIPSK